MDRETFKKRKEMIQALMCDPNYTPMKIKELAILLQVPREQREELKEVLDALLAEGKIGISKRGNMADRRIRLLWESSPEPQKDLASLP